MKEVMDIPDFPSSADLIPWWAKYRASHETATTQVLEKIIDYLRLPPATDEGVMKIALADRSKHCEFVRVCDARYARSPAAESEVDSRWLHAESRRQGTMIGIFDHYNQSEIRADLLLVTKSFKTSEYICTQKKSNYTI